MIRNPPEWLLSIDPGAANAAWALWRKGVLVACGIEKTKAVGEYRPHAVTEDLLMAVSAALAAHGAAFETDEVLVVIEKPQIYQRKSNKDPNDMIDVSLVVGSILAVMDAFGAKLKAVQPAIWKKQVKKRITKLRLEKEFAAAKEKDPSRQEAEVAMWSNHNVVDAIGIGAFYLGRYR